MSEGAESQPLGDCYKAACDSAELLAKIKLSVETDASPDPLDLKYYDVLGLRDNPIEVIHGTAVPPVGQHAGRTIRHAWIEIGDVVLETSRDINRSFKPKSVFYQDYGADARKRYLVKEALQLKQAAGHYGPWDL